MEKPEIKIFILYHNSVPIKQTFNNLWADCGD